jgi:beta-lactam-binding protein with PASTA domain
MFVTPRLLGKKAEEAARIVDRMGLQHRVVSRTSTSGPQGSDRIIVSQRPNPGYPLAADGVVELVAGR